MNKRDMKRDAELAEQCYVNPSQFDYKKYAALIRADEREECAKIFESVQQDATVPVVHFLLSDVAKLIRARSKA
jgi:hypothetical protein